MSGAEYCCTNLFEGRGLGRGGGGYFDSAIHSLFYISNFSLVTFYLLNLLVVSIQIFLPSVTFLTHTLLDTLYGISEISFIKLSQ